LSVWQNLLDVGFASRQQVVDHFGAAVLASPEKRGASVGRLSDNVFSISSTDFFDLSTQFVRKAGTRGRHLEEI
jgi:hypothetical protein